MSNVESFVRFCESEFGKSVMDRETSYVKDHVSPGETILDIGSGIGSLEERFEGYDVIGLDRSKAMVRTARHRVFAPFIRGDARELPVATESVDVVLFVATLAFIPEVDAVLSEVVRILDSGGRIVALLLNTQSEYVQSNLEREGSYFQQIVHRDSEKLVQKLFEFVDGTKDYILGIEDETVVKSDDPSTAAITAVVGSPTRGSS